jgi:hypothetical protein
MESRERENKLRRRRMVLKEMKYNILKINL